MAPNHRAPLASTYWLVDPVCQWAWCCVTRSLYECLTNIKTQRDSVTGSRQRAMGNEQWAMSNRQQATSLGLILLVVWNQQNILAKCIKLALVHVGQTSCWDKKTYTHVCVFKAHVCMRLCVCWELKLPELYLGLNYLWVSVPLSVLCKEGDTF